MPAYDDALFSPPAPSAKVMLRHPNTAATISDIHMLIDSGADVTLIPSSSVDLLGLKLDADESYEVKSFDGRIGTLRAVRLDLIFLRKTFKGRFLLINQDWGILGRDVINHVSLYLDGPRLTWEEQ